MYIVAIVTCIPLYVKLSSSVKLPKPKNQSESLSSHMNVPDSFLVFPKL